MRGWWCGSIAEWGPVFALVAGRLPDESFVPWREGRRRDHAARDYVVGIVLREVATQTTQGWRQG